jgi:hypothetical protein
MLPVVAAFATETAQEREDVVAHDLEHFLRLEMPEPAPPQVLVIPAARVCAIKEDRSLDRFLSGGGLCLGQRLQLVQAAQEQEVGDLLDDLQRVGDPARPEGIPHLVDLDLQRSRHHGDPSSVWPAPSEASSSSSIATRGPAPRAWWSPCEPPIPVHPDRPPCGVHLGRSAADERRLATTATASSRFLPAQGSCDSAATDMLGVAVIVFLTVFPSQVAVLQFEGPQVAAGWSLSLRWLRRSDGQALQLRLAPRAAARP